MYLKVQGPLRRKKKLKARDGRSKKRKERRKKKRGRVGRKKEKEGFNIKA